MIRTTYEEFCRLAQQGNVVPIVQELLADMVTPVSVFRKLDATSDYAFLLESVEQGEQLGRYSFLGADPAVVLRARGDKQEFLTGGEDVELGATPIETLRALLSRYRPVINPQLPPFFGGAVGYMAYDTVRYYERIPDTCPDDLELPDAVVMIVESMIVFDHVKHRMLLVENARIDGSDLRQIYDRAKASLSALKARVLEPQRNGVKYDAIATSTSPCTGTRLDAFSDLSLSVHSNFERDEYMDVVRRAKEYITAGDVFQVVLSQRFCAKISCQPFDVYRSLRAINPSPYMFYLKCGAELQLAGSSPEILSKLQDGVVTVRPIAGTRRRGTTHEEDLALELELLADQKECAEHVMLVDLGRNDVGRVSKFGSVKVGDFMTIERYSHVMHIVSNVTGEAAPGRDGFDVLASTFPAGTLSGAPKIRAMQVIDELEKNRRGPYGGAIVYFSFDGSMDSCITIRTAVLTKGNVYVQAGAGVVADSDPATEYMECVTKARGMITAVEMAEKGLE